MASNAADAASGAGAWGPMTALNSIGPANSVPSNITATKNRSPASARSNNSRLWAVGNMVPTGNGSAWTSGNRKSALPLLPESGNTAEPLISSSTAPLVIVRRLN